MEQKTWTTPEELIEMIHWLSGAPGKRWAADRAGCGFTFGVSNEGRIGMLLDGKDYSCWQQFGPFTFLRDESELEPDRIEELIAIIENNREMVRTSYDKVRRWFLIEFAAKGDGDESEPSDAEKAEASPIGITTTADHKFEVGETVALSSELLEHLHLPASEVDTRFKITHVGGSCFGLEHRPEPSELVKRARELSEKATPGPWRPAEIVGVTFSIGSADRVVGGLYDDNERNNSTFIATARTLIPQLADALEAAEARIAELEAKSEVPE